MNAAHLHLALNHLPVVGLLFALALIVVALRTRSPELARVALWSLVVVAVLGLLAYLTGEGAEEVVERLAGVSEAAIESHEEAALVAVLLVGGLGALAGAGLWLQAQGDGLRRGFLVLTLAATLLVAGWMAWTANLGGRIRHAEIRPDFAGEVAEPEGETGTAEEDVGEAH